MLDQSYTIIMLRVKQSQGAKLKKAVFYFISSLFNPSNGYCPLCLTYISTVCVCVRLSVSLCVCVHTLVCMHAHVHQYDWPWRLTYNVCSCEYGTGNLQQRCTWALDVSQRPITADLYCCYCAKSSETSGCCVWVVLIWPSLLLHISLACLSSACFVSQRQVLFKNGQRYHSGCQDVWLGYGTSRFDTFCLSCANLDIMSWLCAFSSSFFDFCVYTCVLVELSRLKLVKGGGTKCITQYVFGIRSFASYLFWCVYPVTWKKE